MQRQIQHIGVTVESLLGAVAMVNVLNEGSGVIMYDVYCSKYKYILSKEKQKTKQPTLAASCG